MKSMMALTVNATSRQDLKRRVDVRNLATLQSKAGRTPERKKRQMG